MFVTCVGGNVKVSVEKLPGSVALVEVDFSWDELEKASDKAYRKLVLVSTADHRHMVGIFSDPNNSVGVYKDFHTIHIFEHYELHVASLGFGWRPA